MQLNLETAWDAGKPVGGKDFDWGPIGTLPTASPLAPTLSPGNIPEPLQSWLIDAAERIQIPLEFVAIPAIVSLSSLIGRNVGIKPKRKDDWLVVPNLWGAIVGRPGHQKSPAISEALKPLQRLATKAQEDYKLVAAANEASAQMASFHKKALEDRGKAAAKKGDAQTLKEIEAALTQLNLEQNEGIETEKRYAVSDSTTEKLGELLNENPSGLLLHRDELCGWLRSLDKQGREGDREFYLEAWNGTGSYTYDRIGRGTKHNYSTRDDKSRTLGLMKSMTYEGEINTPSTKELCVPETPQRKRTIRKATKLLKEETGLRGKRLDQAIEDIKTGLEQTP